MFYISNGSVYFYKKEENQSYPAEVANGTVSVNSNLPMKPHKDINCFYSLDEILIFGEGLKPKKEKKNK